MREVAVLVGEHGAEVVGPEAFDHAQAETYETLIAYLKHRKQAIRELAHWHLVRLAPVGRDIPFDAAATVAARAKSAEAWKKLIPDGELPPDKKKP